MNKIRFINIILEIRNKDFIGKNNKTSPKPKIVNICNLMQQDTHNKKLHLICYSKVMQSLNRNSLYADLNHLCKVSLRWSMIFVQIFVENVLF